MGSAQVRIYSDLQAWEYARLASADIGAPPPQRNRLDLPALPDISNCPTVKIP